MNNSVFNNKHERSIFHYVIQFLFLVMLAIRPSTLLADMFSDCASCGIEVEDDYFGNAQTCPFKSAVENTDCLTPEDIAFLNAVNATRIINRWYMRVFVGKPKVQLRNFENESLGVLNGLPPPITSFSESILQATLAGGYFWEQWALELELFFSKKINLFGGGTIVGIPFSISTELYQAAAFVNVQYVLPRLFSWYPRRLQIHLDAGIGPALKNTNSTFTIGAISPRSGSTRTFTGAANLGVGARYQVSAHVLVDIAYRYFYLGKVNFGPVVVGTQTIELTAKTLQSNGFFIGAVYQF